MNKFFDLIELLHKNDMRYVLKSSYQETEFLESDDLDSEYNEGLDQNEKNMLKDLIINGALIDLCKFSGNGHIILLRMELGEKFSDSVFFPYLIRLEIHYNKTADFKFVRKHHKVIVIFSLLGRNLTKIPDFSGMGLINLRRLDLSRNNIETINGCGRLPRLKTLDLQNNQIKSLKGLEEFAGCPKLSEIDLSENLISDLCKFEPISHLCNLESIDLSNNRITEINITHKVPKLSSIWLSDNQINKIIAIRNLPRLYHINLKNNQLTKLENMSNLPKLGLLSVDGNPISSFSGMENLPSLREISWIKDFSEKPDEEIEMWKQYFKNLRFKIHFSHNNNLLIHKIMYPTLTYQINEHLSLKLKRDKLDGINPEVGIYVDGEQFRLCMCLLFTIEVNKVHSLESIDSIDELDEKIEPEYEQYQKIFDDMPTEEMFWAHCSNIQAWVEQSYDTRILHRNLAFPLLKKLTEAGDLTAKKVFKEEIAKRYSSGHLSVQEYLREEGYLKFLSEEELTLLKS